MTFVCGSQCFLPPGEDVRGGGSDLHGVLNPYHIIMLIIMITMIMMIIIITFFLCYLL